MNATEEISAHLKTLGLENMNRLPKLIEIRKTYLKLSKQLHPDMHVNKKEETRKEAEESFKNLFNAYTIVTKKILEEESRKKEESKKVGSKKEKSNEEGKKGEEECYDEWEESIRNEFKEMNFTTINSQSVTIKVPTIHVHKWEQVFNDNFGLPIDRSNNGKQYKTPQNVSITLWMKQKDELSTILINGAKNYLKFAIDEIPRLYQEFKSKLDADNSRKRKQIERPPTSIQCDKCEKVAMSEQNLIIHKAQEHTSTFSISKKVKLINKKPIEIVEIDDSNEDSTLRSPIAKAI